MGKSLLSKKSLFRLTAELDSPWFAVYFSLAVLFCWVAAVSEDARRALDICWQAKELAQVCRTDQQRRGTGGDVPCQLCRKGVVCFLISLPTCVYYLLQAKILSGHPIISSRLDLMMFIHLIIHVPSMVQLQDILHHFEELWTPLW